VPALTDPPQQIEQLELREAERAITSLQEEQRSAVLLVGLTRANYNQIASVFDLAIGTIRSWLSRAHEALRKLTDVAPPDPRASKPRRLAAAVTTPLGKKPPADCRSNIAKEVTSQTRRLAAILAAEWPATVLEARKAALECAIKT
jgi:transposase